MLIKDKKNFWSGVMFIVFGGVFLLWSREYDFGTSHRMGPGYFPTVLALLMMFLGLLVLVPSLRPAAPETHVDPVGWKGLIVVLGAVALFGVLLPRAGFILSMVVLIIGSAAASNEFNWKETLISTVVLSTACYLVFVKGLELQFSVWPPFLTE